MKKLKYISSPRELATTPSTKIVYEWEDELIKNTKLKLKVEKQSMFNFYSIIERIGCFDLYNRILSSKELRLRFIMTAKTKKECIINKNTIPVIIDYWLSDEEIDDFCKAYKYCPLILVTNREVYDLFLKKNVKLPFEHWPLSYPDKYKPTDKTFDKKFSFCLFGRPNPMFINYIEKYAELHPDFEYVVSKGKDSNREFYTSKGEFICKDQGRSTYLEMIKQTKITCYSTPGVDKAKGLKTKFNQVTPRLFEMLTNGCMVIGHYPNAADTIWYNLRKFIVNVDTYEEFEREMDRMLNSSIDMTIVNEFMSNHYTSVRAKMLIEICKKRNINIEL